MRDSVFLLGLSILLFVGCAYQQIAKAMEAEETHMEQAASPRTPAEQKGPEHQQMKAEIQRLQEENAQLKAQLNELQQKKAVNSPKKKKTEKPKVSVVNIQKSKVAPPVRHTTRVHSFSANSKRQKKPRIIQISFEDEKNPTKTAN